MIGLGEWQFRIDTVFFKGNAEIVISDKGGKYDFDLKIENFDLPDYTIKDFSESENTLTATVNTDLLKGKDIPISITFEGDTLTGTIKIPMLGKIKLKDGKRVTD